MIIKGGYSDPRNICYIYNKYMNFIFIFYIYNVKMMMVNTKSWTFLVLTWIVLIHSEELDYRLVIHNSDPMARCLDGTSPALYLHEGGDDKKFVVFFVGGGYC